MYAKVKLLNGFKEPLIYKIPEEWEIKPTLNSLVKVPLQKRFEYAVIEELFTQLDPSITFTIKTIHTHEQVDAHYAQFIEKVARYYGLSARLLYQRLQTYLEKSTGLPVECEIAEIKNMHTLTPEQQASVDAILPTLGQNNFAPFLLHGVTGSGKTEIYKTLISKVLEQKKSVIFMVPEVSLAVQFMAHLKASFTNVYGLHSATSAKEKKELWNHVIHNMAVIVVGVHLPIMLPIQNLGLIIVDEEHDHGYQEKKHPRINSKEVALLRAQHMRIPIVLGSATPSISSLYAVERKKITQLSLAKRFAGAFPTIRVVPLLDQKKKRKEFWISSELQAAIADRLQKQEQVIIFINRRGYSFFLQCGACSFIWRCSSCSVSLTVHEDNKLYCHYCTHVEEYPACCSACKAPQKSLLSKGIGTQQVVKILETLFPQARVARADLDTTVNKKKWQSTLEGMHNKTIDILVGTQTITKGYHFPAVTLVGILWADIQLSMPVYNAAEITLQQLIQVAGRAGRQSQESLVIVQTLAEHSIFNYLDEQNYLNFYRDEITFRKELGYPPCHRVAEIEIRHETEFIAEQDAASLATFLGQQNITVLGPSKPPVHKINNIFIRTLFLKAVSVDLLLHAWHALPLEQFSSSIYFTQQPI